MFNQIIKFSLITFSLLLTSCSVSEQKFVCVHENKNTGLLIKSNMISFSTNLNVPFCKKEGLINLYSTDCSYSLFNKDYSSFQFDTVSYQLTYTWSSGGQFGNNLYQCKELK